MTDRLSLVHSPCTTSGQVTEWVYSYNPGLFVCLFAWGLTALSAQIGYIAP